MRVHVRVVVTTGIAIQAVFALVAPAPAQTGGLESPTLWLLVASLAQIVAAAAVMVFFITRRRPRHCPRCGQRLGRGVSECARCSRPVPPRPAAKGI